MKYSKIILILLVMALLTAFPLYGDGVKKIAQTGMKWVSIPIGAKGSALGNAFTAYAGDASALFWNPAGLGMLEGGSWFLSQTNWIAGIKISSGAVSYSTKRWGVFGASFSAVQWGEMHGTQRTSTSAGYKETGAFSPTNWSVGIGYAFRVNQQFSMGAHVKYLYEKLGTALEGTMDNPTRYVGETGLFALDIGTLYYTGFKDLRFGMSLQNFSEEKTYRAESFPLPLTFKFGIAMDMFQFFQEGSTNKLTLSIDAIHPRDFTERLHFGGEYSYNNMLFLRGGYKTNYDEEDWTLGAGLNFKVNGMTVGLNYSYVNFMHFDAVHTFSFEFTF
jgi:hypothetical protein